MSYIIASHIRTLALQAGFDVVGFTKPTLPESANSGLQQFLHLGHHGDMGWMEARSEIRANPKSVWPEVKTIIVLGQNYAPDADPMHLLTHRERGVISVYAQGDDYHDVIKKKLKTLANRIATEFGGDARVYVDTAPVMEKPLAEQAGLGWQGKHTCIVSREYGSWLFLGEIFTSLEVTPDEPEQNHCGTCTNCLDICPTQAFTAPHKLDARKCISYLTIEHKGHIPMQFRKAMGNRIYGCDDCLAVCPWNKFAQNANESAYHPREALKAPLLAELAMLDDAEFRKLFSKSPVKRTGRDRFIRNVLIAIGNSGDVSLLHLVTSLLADASDLVRAAAVWALAQLADDKDFTTMRQLRQADEQDADVIKEWNRDEHT